MRPNIAFDRLGEGSPIIIVLGAFNTRSTGAPLAAATDQLQISARSQARPSTPVAEAACEIGDLHCLAIAADGYGSILTT